MRFFNYIFSVLFISISHQESIEKMQGRFVKMAMEINSTTPSYIWRMEAGRQSLTIEDRARANKYLMRICEIDNER